MNRILLEIQGAPGGQVRWARNSCRGHPGSGPLGARRSLSGWASNAGWRTGEGARLESIYAHLGAWFVLMLGAAAVILAAGGGYVVNRRATV